MKRFDIEAISEKVVEITRTVMDMREEVISRHEDMFSRLFKDYGIGDCKIESNFRIFSILEGHPVIAEYDEAVGMWFVVRIRGIVADEAPDGIKLRCLEFIDKMSSAGDVVVSDFKRSLIAAGLEYAGCSDGAKLNSQFTIYANYRDSTISGTIVIPFDRKEDIGFYARIS